VEESDGTRRDEARPGDVRLLKMWHAAEAKERRLHAQAVSKVSGHPLPQGKAAEMTGLPEASV
jgi:hypothetical protein